MDAIENPPIPGTPTVIAPGSRAAARRRRRLLPALLALAVVGPLAAISVVGTLEYWPGRPFPGFFVLGNRIVPTVGMYSWTGIERGVPFHARVVGLDDVPIASSAAVYERVARAPVGTRFAYTLEKHGERVRLVVPSMTFRTTDYLLTIGIMLAFGIVSSGLGIAVGFVQPDTAAARAYLIQGVLAGLFAVTGAALYQPGLWWMIHPHLVTQATFPAALLHLGLVFPVRRRAVERHPAWLWAPYAVSAGLILWAARDFYAEPPSMAPFHAMYAYSAVSVLGLVALLAVSFAERRTPDVRPQLYAVLPGLAFGTAVGLYGFLNTAQDGGDFPINLVAFTPFIFYVAVGYAIARHDLFDIDTLLKRTLAYGLLTVAVIGLYAGTVAVVETWRPRALEREHSLFTIVFAVLIAVVFEPVRARVQRLVDRLFSRDQVDYRRTVTRLSTDLARLLDLDDIVRRVGRTVHEAFGLRTTTLLVWHGDARLGVRHTEEASAGMPASPDEFGAMTRLLRARGTTEPWMASDGSPHDADREMARCGATLAIPMMLGDDVVGALLLGRRRSGRWLGRADVELLRALAATTAVAVGNAASYRALATVNLDLEGKVAERTRALTRSNTALATANDELRSAQAQLVHSEKMAALGVLVAGVAHEINNPVTFIVGGVDPLEEGLGSLRESATARDDGQALATIDRMARAVTTIAHGAERTARIVGDLQAFARADGLAERALDVHEAIEIAIRLLRPRWADRIQIHRLYGDIPPLVGASDELGQVWMNLLANACDAIPERGNVWVETALDGPSIRVRVRDDGSGIPPEIRGRIFEPFFTSKPQGQGTGLGLSVSHGIVERHGGRIELESTPGSGTTFTVWVPLRPKPHDY